MGGRYCMMDVTGKIKMPGADGKLQDFEFKGHGMEGYDNAKKKFVGTWIDNMGTGIMMSEGDYDPSSKTFTYRSEMERNLAQGLSATVSVKATTNEGMGWVGRGEGIACVAVALVDLA